MADHPVATGNRRNRISELRGVARLAIDATQGITGIVEALHRNIARVPGSAVPSSGDQAGGLSGFVYRRVRGVTRLVGGSLDALLALLEPAQGGEGGERWRDDLISVINGVLGDHLAASGNPLALPMRFFHQGQPLPLEREALAAALPQAGAHPLILLHGLCMNERHWQWKGGDHGARLAKNFGCTPLAVRYNTGRHVSDNGADLARALEALLARWPVPVTQLSLLTHSMGGLVARSAMHQAEQAGMAWRRRLSRVFFLGTPHQGAPLERAGHLIDLALGASVYSAPLARLGHIRSAGITDLREASLLAEDWQGRDRFARGHRQPTRVALPSDVRCYALAASTRRAGPGEAISHQADDSPAYALGDGLVPVRSALGLHKDPARTLAFAPGHRWVIQGLGHLDLLGHDEVAAQLVRWMGEPGELV